MQNLEKLNVQVMTLEDATSVYGGKDGKFWRKVGNFLECFVESVANEL